MKISKQWLEDFVTLPQKTSEEILEELTVQTVEVEETMSQSDSLAHIVVGKITSLEKHPDADMLHVCQVTVGTQTLPVVCGGSNLREGMLVAMGMIGAKVHWHGEADVVELKKTKIRGVVSEGMICAAEEIGLAELFPKAGEREILDLSFLDAQSGTPLADALGLSDVIIDIDNKSMTNRPDLWGHYGMAREFAAMYTTDLKPYNPPSIEEGSAVRLSVDVQDTVRCPRYMAVQVSGVAIGQSPDWMRKRLLAVGIRSINTIVDITNYVMLELGQPMHAFDADKVDGASLTVRMAKKQEKITLLGGDEMALTATMLVIADNNQPLAVAGVKGGHDSGVSEHTTSIIFEAANFEPLCIRKTSAALGVRTDSSSRFEKSLDPTLPELALRRAVELTRMLCPTATVVSNVVDVQSFTLKQGPLVISPKLIRSRIGADISDKEMIVLLERLGFGVEQKKETLVLTIPSWRATGDIAIPEDITEEVARTYGYKNIPTTFPKFSISPTPPSPLRDMTKRIKELLAYEAGYTEVYNYSFVSPDWLAKLGISTENYIELAHPIAKDKPLVRRELVPTMLENVESNSHRFDAVRLFETGRGYRPEVAGPLAHPDKKDHLPGQDEYVALVYAEKNVDVPFFELSSVVRQLGNRLGVALTLQSNDIGLPYVHGGRQAELLVNGQSVGYIGEVDPQVQQKIGIPHRTAFLEINLTVLAAFVQERIAYIPLPIYPTVARDIALVVSTRVEDATLRRVIQAVDSHIVSVELFDVYQGDHVARGMKSVAYHIVYRSNDKTLTTIEVQKIEEQVLRAVKDTCGAEIRQV